MRPTSERAADQVVREWWLFLCRVEALGQVGHLEKTHSSFAFGFSPGTIRNCTQSGEIEVRFCLRSISSRSNCTACLLLDCLHFTTVPMITNSEPPCPSRATISWQSIAWRLIMCSIASSAGTFP